MPAFFRRSAYARAVEEQSAAGFHSDDSDFGGLCRFDGELPDDGNVKAHVLDRVGDLDHGAAIAAQGSAALDAFVGSLKGLYGEHCAITHDDGLPDIQSAAFLGNLVAVLDVLDMALLQRWPAMWPFGAIWLSRKVRAGRSSTSIFAS